VKTYPMKATALAAASLLAASLAHGQGLDPGQFSLTWYGVADLSVAYATSGYGGKTRIEGSGGMQASRLGIRANRAFADGITATAVLEAGVQFDTGEVGGSNPPPGVNVTTASSGGTPGTGPRIFGRQAFGGLIGPWGTVTIGRQYTGSYLAIAVMGSAWPDGLYANQANFTPIVGGMPTRVDNSLEWSTPKFGGFSGTLTYTTGAENNVSTPVPVGSAATTQTANSGQGWDLAGFYQTGPLRLALTTWSVKNGAYNAAAGETGLAKKQGAQIDANYDFGWMYLVGAYVEGKINGGNYENVTKTLSKSSAWALSARFPFGENNRHTVFVSYASLTDKSLLNRSGVLMGGAYWYQLEEKTRLYASYGQLKNNKNGLYALPDSGNLVGNQVAPGLTPKGFEVGMNYNF
jgi:predicted porin